MPLCEMLASSAARARPKSVIFALCDPPSSRMLPGLMSRWIRSRRMGRGQPLGDLPADPQHLRHVERTDPVESLLERLAGDEFHHQVGQRLFADLVHLHHVLMADRSEPRSDQHQVCRRTCGQSDRGQGAATSRAGIRQPEKAGALLTPDRCPFTIPVLRCKRSGGTELHEATRRGLILRVRGLAHAGAVALLHQPDGRPHRPRVTSSTKFPAGSRKYSDFPPLGHSTSFSISMPWPRKWSLHSSSDSVGMPNAKCPGP